MLMATLAILGLAAERTVPRPRPPGLAPGAIGPHGVDSKARSLDGRPALRPAPRSAAAIIGFLYLNEGRNDAGGGVSPNVIAGFAARSDGSLTLLPGSPWETGGLGPLGPAFFAAPRLGVAAAGRRLYAVNQGSDDVAVFTVGAGGGLEALAGSPFGSRGSEPQALALTPDGRFLFVAHTGSRDIVPFSIGPRGEPVAAAAPFDIDGIPDALVVTPDGRFLLASLPFLARVAVLEIAADGGLRQAPGSPFRADANSADGMALGRGGALLYAADANTTTLLLSFYRLGPQGRLQRVGGSPFGAPGGPANILHLMNGGRTLVASLPGQDALASFAIDPQGRPSPAPGSPFAVSPSGSFPTGLASDLSGAFLYVANALAGTVTVFRARPGGGLEPAGEGAATGVAGQPLSGLAFVPQGDADGDGVPDASDDCPLAPDPLQADADRDGRGDICDACPLAPDPGQRDEDGDGTGDACDEDRDGDGASNGADLCPDAPDAAQADADGDGVGDECDNCPEVPNPGQEDADRDLEGDACRRMSARIGWLFAQTEAPDNSIAAYEVDTLGRLRRLSGSPFPTGGKGPVGSTFFAPPRLAQRPSMPPVLYAANEGSHDG